MKDTVKTLGKACWRIFTLGAAMAYAIDRVVEYANTKQQVAPKAEEKA